MHSKSIFVGFGIGIVMMLLFLFVGTPEKESIASPQPVPIIKTINKIQTIKEISDEVEREVIANYIRQYNKKVSKKDINEIYDTIKDSDYKYLLMGIMRRESAFDKSVYSKKKDGAPLAVGLTGINLCNVDELKEQGIIKHWKDLYKIKENIRASEYLIKEYLTLTDGDIIKMLKMYWIGPLNYTHPKFKDATYPEDVLSSIGHIRIKMEIAVSQHKDVKPTIKSEVITES